MRGLSSGAHSLHPMASPPNAAPVYANWLEKLTYAATSPGSLRHQQRSRLRFQLKKVLVRGERSIMVRCAASEVVPRDSNSHPFLPVTARGCERHAHRRLCLPFAIVRAHRAHQAEHCGHIEEPVGRTNTVTLQQSLSPNE